jgi:hypothetical protein
MEAKHEKPAHKSVPTVRASTAKRYSSPLILTQSLLATAALIAVVGGTTYMASRPIFGLHSQAGDNVGESQKQERLTAFTALGTVQLVIVPEADLSAAIDGMQLSPAGKQALLSDLTSPSETPASIAPSVALPSTPTALADPRATPEQGATQAGVPATQTATSALPVAEAGPRKESTVRLAWISLWDTDAEDGDAVRIDSQGYSRTVLLSKQPVTFAIPVPANGIVNITGVRDGEGGGVTVGLASGASKAVFPIMSVGQVLGLRVKVN